MKAEDIKKLLAPKNYDISSERLVQDRVEEIFLSEGLLYIREAELSHGDRVDFLVGTVGVEVKLQAPVTALMRQLHRYAQSDRVEELLLVTTNPRLSLIPKKFNNKPITVLVLITALL